MIGRYKKTIISLLLLALKANQNPYESSKEWFLLQKSIIKKRRYIENKILLKKAENKEYQKIRKDRNKRYSKKESLGFKKRISSNKEKIEDYRVVIHILSRIADIVPFSFIDKYDIKPQNFKEDSGFIIGKKGFSLEYKIFNYVFNKGKGIAIFNDITTVLNYGDITLVSREKHPFIIECKSGERLNDRALRQKSNTEKLINYFETDSVHDLYGNGFDMTRAESVIKEKEYSSNLSSLIAESNILGFSSLEVENGLFYIAINGSMDENVFHDFLRERNIAKPIAGIVNNYLYQKEGYKPIAISLKNPVHYWQMITGETTLLVLIDFEKIESFANQHEFSVELLEDDNFILEIIIKDDHVLKLSRHFFERIISEFVSIEWMLTNMVKTSKNHMSKINGA